MLPVGLTSLLRDVHFRIFKVYMLLLLWASILVQFQVESTRSKLNSGFPQEVGFNIYFYGVLFFCHKFCFLKTSWSPNSTDLHLDFYLLCQQTNTKDIAGQSATLKQEFSRSQLLSPIWPIFSEIMHQYVLWSPLYHVFCIFGSSVVGLYSLLHVTFQSRNWHRAKYWADLSHFSKVTIFSHLCGAFLVLLYHC